MAVVTRVRFLARVDSRMPGQAIAPTKFARTLFALERPLQCVDSFVFLHVFLKNKSFRTNPALVRFIVRVDALVTDAIAFQRESALAKSTREFIRLDYQCGFE